ncbi:DNA-3-methyladenine glycosylase family protein [Methylocaldum szegediense]|uniref:DNA-3-methyladenine glycosylase II n=1 Tax=Methylocaldum szegediense TaxID=73780 RepID=A0ABN8WZB2_9GAMM|nr:DNA-3-methyladenine glycosylase 2 family protein [Methylocaldum szegediense]CAI8763663.1 DNA-3-methyladenine glycosylase II [Methylocaldum szegediense]
MIAVPNKLTEIDLEIALAELSARDADLARLYTELGKPPMWARNPGFSTLIRIILEQQVSLASARAAFERLLASASPLTPESFLALHDTALARIGFSRQKMAYGRYLAQSIAEGRFDLDKLDLMDDETAKARLIELKGIGPWTADIYLLMALRRPDAWPAGDLGLIQAVQDVKRLPSRPNPETMVAIAEIWRPWRAVAARMLWHHYLSRLFNRPANGNPRSALPDV